MHGYVGLAIYLLLWWLTWRCASEIIRTCKMHAHLRWAAELAAMIQVALVGFWVGGTFLGLAYFDLPYILLALLVLTKRVVTAEVAKNADQPISSRRGNCWDTQSKIALNVWPSLTRAGIGQRALALTCRLRPGVPRALPGRASVT